MNTYKNIKAIQAVFRTLEAHWHLQTCTAVSLECTLNPHLLFVIINVSIVEWLPSCMLTGTLKNTLSWLSFYCTVPICLHLLLGRIAFRRLGILTVPQHDVLLDSLWLWKSQLFQYESIEVVASLFCAKNWRYLTPCKRCQAQSLSRPVPASLTLAVRCMKVGISTAICFCICVCVLSQEEGGNYAHKQSLHTSWGATDVALQHTVDNNIQHIIWGNIK